jgi:hypothetical protein
MGWVHDVPEDDLYDHEGYPVAVLADGSEPEPLRFPVPGREGITTRNSAWWLYTGEEGRPLATSVKAGCTCGWRSTNTFPIDFEHQEATDGWEDNSGPFAAWTSEHIDALLGTTMPTELREALGTVKQLVGQLATERPLVALTAIGQMEKLIEVQAPIAGTWARSRKVTWEAIGRALRTSRQAAYQRFGKYTSTVANNAD